MKKSTILRDVNNYYIFKNVILENELPKGQYKLIKNPDFSLHLEKIEDLRLPEKIYSNDSKFVEHVMSQWNGMGKGNLGVVLEGSKGLGKSFTGNLLAIKSDVVIIKITEKLERNVKLFDFLSSIDQDVLFLVDEFEKIFETRQNQMQKESNYIAQEDFLSFLDDGGSIKKNKKLFIFTCNNTLNEFLKDRPSRIRYYKRYLILSDEVIKEICADLLVDKTFEDDLINNLPIKNLNMDVLIQIINEVNYHKKPYSSFKDFFNFVGAGGNSFLVTFQNEHGQTIIINESFSRTTRGTELVGVDEIGDEVYVSETKIFTPDLLYQDLKGYIEDYSDWDIGGIVKKNKVVLRFTPINTFLKSYL